MLKKREETIALRSHFDSVSGYPFPWVPYKALEYSGFITAISNGRPYFSLYEQCRAGTFVLDVAFASAITVSSFSDLNKFTSFFMLCSKPDRRWCSYDVIENNCTFEVMRAMAVFSRPEKCTGSILFDNESQGVAREPSAWVNCNHTNIACFFSRTCFIYWS